MRKTLLYSALILLSALFIAPFYWTFMTAIKSSAELYQFPPVFWPSEWHWENFAAAWNKQPFGTYLTNSVIVVVLSTIGQLISSSLVAYGFARFRFPGRDPLFILLLATMMIPWDVKMIPLYMEFNLLGWINTLKPLIVPAYFADAFFVFLLRQYIMTVPMEIDEAARMDGANGFQVFWRVTVPQLRPIILLTAIMSTNGTLQLFDESWALTRGGPAYATMSMSHYLYEVSFQRNPNFGYGAALAYVILILVAILAFIQLKVGDKRD